MYFLEIPPLGLKNIALDSIAELSDFISQNNNFQDKFVILGSNGRKISDFSTLRPDSHLILTLNGGLLGGKGGFGSMLRALGAQIEKTTNKDACRDLSGRRIRDINQEEKLKKWVAKKADREREEQEKKRKKIEKLERIAKGENKHEFHDPKFEKDREIIQERVHDAVQQAMRAKKEAEIEEPKAGPSGLKRKLPVKEEAASKPKKGLWMGDGLTESDLESSSDEDEE